MSRYYGFLNESFDKMYLQENSSNISAELDAAYKGWYYTIVGTGGNIEDWKKGIQDLLTKEDIGTITKWIDFKGKDMNDKYGLTGDNRYPDDLTFLAFAIDGLNTGKLAMFKLRMGDRWFTDIVDNDRRREGYDDDASDLDESLKEARISPEDQIDSDNIKSAYWKRYDRSNAKLSDDEINTLNKYNAHINTRREGNTKYISIEDNDNADIYLHDRSLLKNDKSNYANFIRKRRADASSLLDYNSNKDRHLRSRNVKQRRQHFYKDNIYQAAYDHPNQEIETNWGEVTSMHSSKNTVNSYINYTPNTQVKNRINQNINMGKNIKELRDYLSDRNNAVNRIEDSEKQRIDITNKFNNDIQNIDNSIKHNKEIQAKSQANIDKLLRRK